MAKPGQILGRKSATWCVVAVLAIASAAVGQTTYNWRTAANGVWSDTARWNPSTGTPGGNPQDKAYITKTGAAYKVSLDRDIVLGDLRLGSSTATLDLAGYSLTATGESLMSSGTLDLAGGRFTQVGGTFMQSGITVVGGPVRLIDAKLVMNSLKAGAFVTQGACTLESGVNADQQISIMADGHAASLSGFLSNKGTINLDSVGAYDVTLGTGNELPQSFNNAGVVNVLAGGGGGRRIACPFSNDIAGTINFHAATTTIGSFTNQGSFNIAPGSTVQMTGAGDNFSQVGGTINVQGAFRIIGGGFTATRGTITGGPITLIDSSFYVDITGPSQFVLHGNCKGGGGTHGGYEISVIADGRPALLDGPSGNRGIINLDSVTPDDAGLTTTLQISNGAGGTINVLPGAGGLRTITGTLNNNAQGIVNLSATTYFFGTNKYTANYGEWNLLGAGVSAVFNQSLFGNYGGTIRGLGTIDVTASTFTNKGIIAPGLSIGVLNVLGDLHQTSTGTLAIDLAGNAVAGEDYDQLKLTGTAYLDGTLQITLLNGFTPELGNAFKVLDFATAQGQFQSFNLPGLGAGLSWDTSTLSTDGTIRITPEPVSGILAAMIMVTGVSLRRTRRPL